MRTRLFPLLLILAVGLTACQPTAKKEVTPQPPEKAVSIVFLIDADKETPEQAAVYNSKALREFCTANGHQIRILDIDTKSQPTWAKPYIEAAAGKTPLMMIGRDGAVKSLSPLPASGQVAIDLVERNCGNSEEDESGSVWAAGQRRYLGLKPVRPGAEKRWATEGAENEPLVPRERWQDVDFSWAATEAVDQDGYSCCCACASDGALEAAIVRQGLPKVETSVVDLYSRINGGRDRGASIEDALEELTTKGVCTTDYAGMWGVTKTKHKAGFESDRSRHRILRATWLPSVDHVGSALQRRRPVVFGTMVTDKFAPDEQHVVGPKSGRSRGGHALYLVGAKQIGGEWYFRVVNSWGVAWGDKGSAWLHESWIDPVFGAWAVYSIVIPSDDRIARAKGACCALAL